MSDLDLTQLRAMVAVVLDNSDDYDFDDNPTDHNTCRGCGWDSRRDPKTPGGGLSHKPDCTLEEARRVLRTFADATEPDDVAYMALDRETGTFF